MKKKEEREKKIKALRAEAYRLYYAENKKKERARAKKSYQQKKNKNI